MTVTGVSLLDPASGNSMTLMPTDGISVMILDVAATARTSGTQNQTVYDLVGANGSYDVTKYLTEAAVTLTMTLFPPAGAGSIESLWDQISEFLDPSLRPVLIVTNDQWLAERQIGLRFNSDTKPFSDPTNWVTQISWVAPAAVWEDVTDEEYFIGAFVPQSTGILSTSTGVISTSTGVIMNVGQTVADTIVTNPGSYSAQWQALLYGPCTGPVLANDTTGQFLSFSSLTILAGDYILLDSLQQTAQRASDGANILPFMDWTISDWFVLAPGTNLLRYDPASLGTGGGSEVDLTFRAAYKA